MSEPKSSDENGPPIDETALRLARIEQWIARVAHTMGNHSAQFDRFVGIAKSEFAQLHGGVLLIDGTTARLERRLFPVTSEAGGEAEPKSRTRKQTPTDQFPLLEGVEIQIPKSVLARWTRRWKVGKVLYYVAIASIAIGGWILHLVRLLKPR